MIEGGSSRERLTARLAAFRGEAWLESLIEVLVEASVDYLAGQVEAGVDCVQIFDSWAVDLPRRVRERCASGRSGTSWKACGRGAARCR